MDDFINDDLVVAFVLYMEGKMDKLPCVENYNEFSASELLLKSAEVGEEMSPSKALLFKNGSVSLISGKSSSLEEKGYHPFEDSHFNTQYALTVTQAVATFHGILRSKGVRRIDNEQTNTLTDESIIYNRDLVYQRQNSEESVQDYMDKKSNTKIDPWTSQISRHSLMKANLSLMCSQFRSQNINSRIINKLAALQNDVQTLAKFIQFVTAMQMENNLQSLGPISMCDIWIPKSFIGDEENTTIVIRLRGGPNLQAPPMRDITWIWLTLLRPEILQERYMELCEAYSTYFNNTVKRYSTNKSIDELTLFDIMRDLGDSFLHAFLTVVHKFTLSGIWCLDRRLHTSEGLQTLSESLSFLIDNGIIGSLLII